MITDMQAELDAMFAHPPIRDLKKSLGIAVSNANVTVVDKEYKRQEGVSSVFYENDNEGVQHQKYRFSRTLPDGRGFNVKYHFIPRQIAGTLAVELKKSEEAPSGFYVRAQTLEDDDVQELAFYHGDMMFLQNNLYQGRDKEGSGDVLLEVEGRRTRLPMKDDLNWRALSKLKADLLEQSIGVVAGKRETFDLKDYWPAFGFS